MMPPSQAVETDVFVFEDADAEVRVQCRWSINPHQHFVFVGIVFEHVSSTPIQTPGSDQRSLYLHHHEGEGFGTRIGHENIGSVAAFDYLIKGLHDAKGGQRLGGLIVPSTAGYIARSDIVPFRLTDCEPLEGAVSFSEPLQEYPAFNHEDRVAGLPKLLSVAVGGFFVREDYSLGETPSVSQTLESQLSDRFSFPWILNEVPTTQQRTLAIVEGGSSTPDYDGLAARVYPSARALGLHLIVLDSPGHWLEDGDYNHLRESFIPVHLTSDSTVLADRIVEALRGQIHRIGGIVSFYDEYQVGVAAAAERLSLPTVSPRAYLTATNKYETSVAAGRRAYRGHDVATAATISRREDLQFPVIVKPCSGWMSEGVFKVAKRSELEEAVSKIDFKRHGTEYVVEEYCDGPEVDVNVIIYDGELVFYEISDDYPKAAEGNGSRSVNTFIEMDSVAPSKLPAAEQLTLQRTFHDILRRSGLNYGVFHIEGRVKNSTMEFRKDNDGIFDLHPRDANDASSEPSAFVLDINPRPPGQAAAVQPLITYGVDYHAMSMLIALRDTARVSALAQPFAQRNQYWSDMIYIPTDFPPDRVGIFDSDDICEELKRRRPDLARYISTCACFVKRGEKVSHPSSGVLTWVAYYNVFSRTSRSHVLEIANEVRRETRYVVS